MTRAVLAIATALTLMGCAQNAMWVNPQTGQVQQCTSTMPATLPLLAQSDIDKCGEALERMGWKKQ